MFSKKEDLSTLMSSILNKSSKNGRPSLEKSSSKGAKMNKSHRFFKKKSNSRAKSRHKRTESGYLNFEKLMCKK
jgi:hypothetical protein